jgi:type IV pilus assembly protein PilC
MANLAKQPAAKSTTVQFTWSGIDKKNKEVKGEIVAASESMAKIALRGKGITVKKIKKSSTRGMKKITASDIAVFTRQLATMMRSGVPLLQSFDIVANGHENPSVAKLLYDIKSSVETGSSLADAFKKHPDYFDNLFCSLVAAGEKAGILDMILDRLAEYQEKMQGIKKKIKSALTYPIAVMSIAFIVTAILMIFVVPSFKEVFTSFGAELPAPTQFVMDLSEIFVSYWYVMVGSIVGFIYFMKNLLKTSEKARQNLDKMILKMPIFGKIIQKAIIARWCRTLATMFSAGVPLVEALDSVAGASGNYIYESATKNIQKEVASGNSLTVCMQQQNVFPNMLLQMAAIGEESGSLDAMLNKVAEFYEEEVDVAVEGLSSLMEPLIIAFLGVMVGGLVVAMYLPIFKMASTV